MWIRTKRTFLERPDFCWSMGNCHRGQELAFNDLALHLPYSIVCATLNGQRSGLITDSPMSPPLAGHARCIHQILRCFQDPDCTPGTRCFTTWCAECSAYLFASQ